jgi:L-asparagine transporter-like permease
MDAKVKLILSIALFGIISGALIQALLNYQFPEYYPGWYESIPVFFIVLESSILIYADSSSRKATQKQMLNVYMLTKVIKVFAALIFIGIYALTIKENIKSFVLIFMIFYLLFLAFESYLFLRIEKRLKKKQQ